MRRPTSYLLRCHRACRCLCCSASTQQAIKDDAADLDNALLRLLEAEERACVSVKVASDNIKRFKNLCDFSNSTSPIDLSYMVGAYLDCVESVSQDRVIAVGSFPQRHTSHIVSQLELSVAEVGLRLRKILKAAEDAEDSKKEV